MKRISTSQFEPVVQDRESTKMHEFKDVRERRVNEAGDRKNEIIDISRNLLPLK